MSEFKMRTRPKKPSEPETVYFNVGCYVTLAYLNECVRKFIDNNGLDERDVMVEADEGCDGYTIELHSVPASMVEYEVLVDLYKVELASYKRWAAAHTKEIEKHKEEMKVVRKRNKLERTRDRLTAELAAVEGKLK